MKRKQESRYWNEDVESLPWNSDKRLKLQLTKIRRQIRHCYGNTPYYKKKFDALGIKPDDIRTWEDFRALPVLCDKEEERKSQEESLAKEGHPYSTYLGVPLERVTYVSSTGGTTGVPTFSYLFSEEDFGFFAEAFCRIFWWVGLRPGDTIANIFAMCMHVMGVHVTLAAIKMGLRCIPIGAESRAERILRLIDITRPKCLFGTPPLMEHLIERCPTVLSKEVGDLGIKILLCGGAPGAGIPSVRKKLEDAYKARVFDSQPQWVSCDSSEYYGMHFLSPDLYVWPEDLVDPESNKPLEVKDGAIGHGIFTHFRKTKPMLKYGFGDLLQVFTKECPGCGFKGYRGSVVGRVDEMLIIKGVNVYPTAVKGVINSFIPRLTGEMRIILNKPGPAVDPPMKISIEYGKGINEDELPLLKKEIEDRLHAQLEFRADVIFVPPQTFERAGGVTAKGALIEKKYERP